MKNFLWVIFFTSLSMYGNDNYLKREIQCIKYAKIKSDSRCDIVLIGYEYHPGLIFSYVYVHNKELDRYGYYVCGDRERQDLSQNLFIEKKKQAQLFLQRTKEFQKS